LESFRSQERVILEQIATGEPLSTVLEAIVQLVEGKAPGMLCSILLLGQSGRALHTGAAPSLPLAYVQTLDGARIGPNEGSCGAAASTGEPVLVDDIATHPNWINYRHLALPHGLRACWSTPIFSPERTVLGTFAMYYATAPRSPSAQERQWVQAATDIAAIAIVHHRDRRALEERATRLRILNEVSEAVRSASTSDEVLQVAARILGQALGVSRCGYANVDLSENTAHIPYDYADGCPSIAGKHDLSLFPALVAAFKRGGPPVVLDDVVGIVSANEQAALQALNIRSLVCCSLIRHGELRALMAVLHHSPREYTSEEVALVQDVVERCWSVIEQRNSEAKLRESDALLRVASRAAKLGAWALQLPTRRFTWSEEVRIIHGLPEETAPNYRDIVDAYGPEYRAALVAALAICESEGKPFDLELQLTTRDGRGHTLARIGAGRQRASKLGGAAPTGTEDGSRGQARGRCRARLQQHADRHPELRVDDAGAPEAERPDARRRARDRDRGRAREPAHATAARVQPPASAHATRGRRQRRGGGHRAHAGPARRRRRRRDVHPVGWKRACAGRSWADRASDHELGGQRARRHAQGRQHHDRDAVRRARR
jgi:GAF domain-containing protein